MTTRNKVLAAVGVLLMGAGALAYGVPISYVLIGGLLLLCPAMMFMHGHGGHEESKKERSDTSSGMPVDESEKRSRQE